MSAHPEEAKRPVLKILPFDDLFIDERYQRDLDPIRVRRIIKKFSWNQFGCLEVSERSGGQFAVFDGQHRYNAALRLNLKEGPCIVHSGLTPQEEATLFVLLQKERRNLSHVDRFHAEVFAGGLRANAINDIILALGLRIGKPVKGATNYINAVVKLESIYAKYGLDHLRYTLEQIREIWSDDPGGLQGSFLSGMAYFLADYGDSRYTEEVRAKLATVTPLVIIRRAEVVHAGDQRPGVAVALSIRKVSGVRGRPRNFKKSLGIEEG